LVPQSSLYVEIYTMNDILFVIEGCVKWKEEKHDLLSNKTPI